MDSIVRMANDIARFHVAYPPDEGRSMVAEHINKFWAPSMRTRFLELVGSNRDDFHPLVLEAVDLVHCAKRNPIDLTKMDRTGTGG